ncbi:UNVERIFIED_CONTAM: hypothetical protein RMT77_002250 [Armadillidium vulgare]
MMPPYTALLSAEHFSNVSLIIYTLIIIIITVWILKFIRHQKKFSVLNSIPGPKTVFLLGNAIDFMGGPREFFECIVHKICSYPEGLTRVWIMHRPFVFIYGASGVEAILSNSKNLEKGSDYKNMHSWLGLGLLTSSGSLWHMRRKMLTPAFHFKILEEFIEVFNQQSQKFVNKLQKYSDGKPFNIFPLITLATLDIILETAMGRSINAQDNPQSEYVKAVYDMGRIIMVRFARPWLQSDFIFKRTKWGRLEKKSLEILHKFSLDTIRERRKEYKRLKSQKEAKEDEIPGKKKRQAFLDLLIEYSEQNEFLTEENIREEVDTFMFEGHDTTAAGINWTIYLLGLNPEIQEKVYKELESIFEKSERPASYADIREMNYLECCIKESLRLLPSVPYFSRCLTEDMIIDGYLIPKETDTVVVPYALHRDPKHFPDPLKFQPERFLPENSVKRNPYAYIPFSAGPRNCIGQKFALLEEKVVLSSFFRKFRVESLEKFEDLKLSGDLIMRPEEEMFVKIFSRNDK